VLIFIVIFSLPCVSQTGSGNAGNESTSESFSADEFTEPRGFRGIELGMELEAVKDLLKTDPYFDYRGDPDVSFLPQTVQTLIECRGNSYIERAYFQFHEQRLATMILVLDRKKIDHYSVFTTLTEKLGPFTSLTPFKVTWEFEDLLLALERPLSVKYIDRKVFDQQLREGEAGENLRKTSRDLFLENF
jgi:hypothetical protein